MIHNVDQVCDHSIKLSIQVSYDDAIRYILYWEVPGSSNSAIHYTPMDLKVTKILFSYSSKWGTMVISSYVQFYTMLSLCAIP